MAVSAYGGGDIETYETVNVSSVSIGATGILAREQGPFREPWLRTRRR